MTTPKTLHVVSFSGGKDSLATLLRALERCPRESIIPVFADTDNEDAQLYTYLDYIETVLGIKIVRLKADFAEEIAAKREFIARDVRTVRTYTRVPRTDRHGNVIYRRNNAGEVALRLVWRDGAPDLEGIPRMRKAHGTRQRWSNKAKRRALAVLHPSGNAFLDLCMWKGRFPSRKVQFCTEELKRNMIVGYQLDLIERGHRVVSWQGIRREESANRRHAKTIERIGPHLWVYRPIAHWTAQQAFALAEAHGIRPNPLYLQGMGRVGCMPCINCNKGELRQIAARLPHHIDRVEEWECIVSACAKRGGSTFMTDAHDNPDRRAVFADLNIRARVEWSKTSRGGRQYNLLDALENDGAGGCTSSYGLCERWEAIQLHQPVTLFYGSPNCAGHAHPPIGRTEIEA